MAIGTTAAIIGASVLGAGASMAASSKAAKAQQAAAETASNAQLQAAEQSNALQRYIYETNRQDLAPWRTQGESALNALAATLGGTNLPAAQAPQQAALSPVSGNYPYFDAWSIPTAAGLGDITGQIGSGYQDNRGTAYQQLINMIETGPGVFEKDPGYQFRLDEGVKALDRSAAARGRVYSGAQDKAVTRYGQDYASNEYDKFINRYYQKANFLSDQHNQGVNELLQRGQFLASEDQRRITNDLAKAGFMGNQAANALAFDASIAGTNRGQVRENASDYMQGQNFLTGDFLSRLTPYQSLAGIGLTTAQNQAASGNTYANAVNSNTMNAAANIGNLAQAAGEARASGYINSANALTGNMQSGLNNMLLMNALNSRGSTGAGTSVLAGGVPDYNPLYGRIA